MLKLFSLFFSFPRLVKLKGLQSDLDSEVSSNKGQMESLKSKNNVSIKI